MTVGVSLTCSFRVVVSDADLFQVADALMEALLAQEEANPAVLDSAVGVNGRDGRFEVDVSASGESEAAAAETAQAAIAAAIRAVGGNPPLTVALEQIDRSASPMALA